MIDSDVLFNGFEIKLRSFEILFSWWDDEMFFSLESGSFVLIISDEVLVVKLVMFYLVYFKKLKEYLVLVNIVLVI